MSQTHRESLTEAVTNVAVGYLLAVGTQLVVFPLLGLTLTFGENLGIGALFTVVSLARSYLLRQLFERRSRRRSGRLT
jgi:membrane protein implicated in regulation of membrane protease activity